MKTATDKQTTNESGQTQMAREVHSAKSIIDRIDKTVQSAAILDEEIQGIYLTYREYGSADAYLSGLINLSKPRSSSSFTYQGVKVHTSNAKKSYMLTMSGKTYQI